MLVKSDIKNVNLHIGAGSFQFRDGFCDLPAEALPETLSLGGYRLTIADRLRKYRKILLIRNMGLGDVLMVTPLLRFIRDESPDSILHFAVFKDFFDLIRNQELIDKPVVIGQEDNDYDLVINLNLFVENSKEANRANRIDLFAEAINVTLENRELSYIVTREEKNWAKEVIRRCH